MTAIGAKKLRLRVLVVIASYGNTNLRFLKKIIETYRHMAFDTDVVVLSEAPKDLGPEIEVIVGLPSKNPWTLPFAHKAILANRVDQYSLFIYSEDDIGVTEANIESFLKVASQLRPDEIPGFLRFELDRNGRRFMPDVHGSFHWKPESVRRRGSCVIGEFTNEHAGFYVLTRSQLKAAIRSRGFLKAPYEGRYGLPETAATDIYTSCGLRKVICISALEHFLIHHMPNRYVGRLGLYYDVFLSQVQALLKIGEGKRSAATLCPVEPRVLQRNWSKRYDEDLREHLNGLIPAAATTLLSVGVGQAVTELQLRQRGLEATIVPLDSVVAAPLEKLGFEVISGTLNEVAEQLNGRTFGCVLISRILHLQPTPWEVLRRYACLVREGGTLLLVGYNFDFLPHRLRRFFAKGEYKKLEHFNQSGIFVHGIGAVKREIKRLGFRILDLRWFNDMPPQRLRLLRRWPPRLMKRNWIIQASRVSEN